MPTSLSPRSKAAKAKVKASSKHKSSALDSKQRELLEAQSKLEAEIQALKETIAEGPRREAARRQQSTREYTAAAISAATRPQQFRHSAVVADPRFADTPIVRRTKSKPQLRKERRAAQLQFLALVVVLAAAVCWALHLLVS